MGRRSRARERAVAEAAAGSGTAPAPERGRRSWVRTLNPFKFRQLNRSRARAGALGFGLAAVLFAILGMVTGDASWFSSAVLLGILTLAWGVTAALLGRGDPSS
jgi:anti-sigma factor RsiW